MLNPVNVVPEYIRQKYPSAQALDHALYNGEIIRDCYGRFHLREEFQPQISYYNPYYFMAKPAEEPIMKEFDFFNIEGVRGYYKEESDGFLIELVSAEDIARGAGLVRIETKSSHTSVRKEYESFLWDRFNDYAQRSLDTLQQYIDPRVMPYIKFPIDRDSYIPIELAVRVINKCNSKKAEEFQSIVAVKIANEIRNLNRQKHDIQMVEMQNRINDLQSRLDYHRQLVDTKTYYSTTEIAKDFCISPQLLNLVLNRLDIIYKVNNTWQVYQNLTSFGFTENKIRNDEGSIMKENYWTSFGREFICNLLIKNGFIIGADNTQLANDLLIR